jgi:hypothetical protein
MGFGLIGITFLFQNGLEAGITVFLMGVIFMLAGVWFIFGYFGNRLIVNQRYIQQRKWLGNNTVIDWARLEKVRFSAKSGNFILNGINGEKLKLAGSCADSTTLKQFWNSRCPMPVSTGNRWKSTKNSLRWRRLHELKLDNQP